MKISGNVVTGGSDQFERQQPIRLKRGLYGGILKSYTMPKNYQKFQSTEMEEKFFVRFLITHDAGARPLPKYSEAYCGVRTKLFYDPEKDVATTLVRLYAALLAGKFSAEEIAGGADMPDFDDLIGFPAMVYVKPSAGPDKNGIIANTIDTQAGGFAAPDQAFRKAAATIYRAADLRYSENGGLRYLKSPETEYEDSAAVPSHHGNGEPAGGDEPDDSDLPF